PVAGLGSGSFDLEFDVTGGGQGFVAEGHGAGRVRGRNPLGNVADVDRSLGGSSGDVRLYADLASRTQVGLVDLEVGQAGDVGTTRGDEIEATVEQTAALERGGLGDTVEGFERRVDLKLVGRNLGVG